MKKLNEEQQKEMEEIKSWSLVILEYIGRFSQPVELSFHGMATQILLQTFEKGDLRGMRLIFKDLKEWAKGLSKEQYAALNEQLKIKFGRDLKNWKSDS